MNDIILMLVQNIENMLENKKIEFIQCTTSDSVIYNFNGKDYKISLNEIKGGADNE